LATTDKSTLTKKPPPNPKTNWAYA
jgi:hypothetical protein